MRSTSGDVVDISLVFPGKTRAVDLLHQAAHRSGVDLEVVRGRVTEREARYEVRMKGLHDRIEKAVRMCAERGARRRILKSKAGAKPLILVGRDQLDRSGTAPEPVHSPSLALNRSGSTSIQVARTLLSIDEA